MESKQPGCAFGCLALVMIPIIIIVWATCPILSLPVAAVAVIMLLMKKAHGDFK